MDIKDLEKELGDLNAAKIRMKGKRVDFSVKNASLKVIISKLLAIIFLIAIAVFAIYTVINAQTANIDFKVAAALAVVYLALGAYVSIKLWNIDFIGWLALFFISLAGIGLPLLSVVNHGMMVGTFPIIAISVVALIGLWLIRDLYRVKKLGDIFTPGQ